MDLKELESNYRQLDIKVGSFGEKIEKLDGKYSDMKDATDRLHVTMQGMGGMVKESHIVVKEIEKLLVRDIANPSKKGLLERQQDNEEDIVALKTFCQSRQEAAVEKITERKKARAKRVSYIVKTLCGAAVSVLVAMVIILASQRIEKNDKNPNPAPVSENR